MVVCLSPIVVYLSPRESSEKSMEDEVERSEKSEDAVEKEVRTMEEEESSQES